MSRDTSKEAQAAEAIIKAAAAHWKEARHKGKRMFTLSKQSPHVSKCYVCHAVLWSEEPESDA